MSTLFAKQDDKSKLQDTFRNHFPNVIDVNIDNEAISFHIMGNWKLHLHPTDVRIPIDRKMDAMSAKIIGYAGINVEELPLVGIRIIFPNLFLTVEGNDTFTVFIDNDGIVSVLASSSIGG